jgi:hypothetical protein
MKEYITARKSRSFKAPEKLVIDWVVGDISEDSSELVVVE